MTSRSKSNKPITAKRSSRVKGLKVLGSTLLLFAFGSQMYQIKVSDSENTKMEANELDGRQHIKSLEYEILYFSGKAATGIDDATNLRDAAIERVVGRAALAATSGENKDANTFRLRELFQAADRVHDLPSFNEFMGSLQKEIDTSNTSELNSLIDTGKNADVVWWVYVAIYVIGSVCLLTSQWLEKNPTD